MIYLLNWRTWAAIGLLAILASTHWKAYHSGAASVQAAWDARIVVEQSEYMKLQQETRDKESKLQADKESLRKAKNAQIAKLDADLADALERLHNRPERPREGDMPQATGTGQIAGGCTGAQLFRSDSEVLTRIGRNADELRISLKACYSQYDQARKVVNAE